MTASSDVVIVGGGIVGMSTAYFLAVAGVKSVVVERDSVGSHASGFAYGSLSALGGAGIPGPVSALSESGTRIHRDFSRSLPEETGVDIEYRQRPYLSLLFSDEEVAAARAILSWRQQQSGYDVRWMEAGEARDEEPRISDELLGAVYIEGYADVEPYRLMLALAQASEKLGVTIRHGQVTGLKRAGDRVTAVRLAEEEIACNSAVIAMGPWAGEASTWMDVPINVRPLKGQILRLRASGPPFRHLLAWADNYATTKLDELLWVGTTEEEAGFDACTTNEARDRIMASLLKVVPSMAEARLEQQTACLRPLSGDGMPLLGRVQGWEGVYVATGAGRKGILLGPAMGRIIADLVVTGRSDIPIDAFDPGRFGG